MPPRSWCPLREHSVLGALAISCLSIVLPHCGQEQSSRGSGELGAGAGAGDSSVTLDALAGPSDGVANDDSAPEVGQTDGGVDANDSVDANCIEPPTALAAGTTMTSPVGPYATFPPANWVLYSTLCVAYPFTIATTALLLAISKHDSTGTTTSCGIVEGCNPAGSVLASAPVHDIAATVQGPGTYTFTTCVVQGGPISAMEYDVEDVPPPATNIDCAHAQNIPAAGINEPRVIDGMPRYYSFVNETQNGTGSIVVTPLDDSGGTISVSVRTVCSDPQTEIGSSQPILWLGNSPQPARVTTSLNIYTTYYVVVLNIPFANRYALSWQSL